MLRAGTWSISAGVAVVAVAIVVKSAATYAPALAHDGSRSERLGISVIQKWHPNSPAGLAPAIWPVPNGGAAHIAILGTAISPPEATPFEDAVFFEERFSFQARLRFIRRTFRRDAATCGRCGNGTAGLRARCNDQKCVAQSRPRALSGCSTPVATTAVNSGVRAPLARQASLSSPDNQNRTAIYDISSQLVYLPNGRKLEAHSGFNSYMDDPRYVHVKSKGSTPPNTYRLVLRENLFHGVRAIRLIPVGDGNMFGREGILAHHYLLGPNGQSNGCVSFANYPEFLNAYLNGEIDRLVVVERLENPPSPMIAAAWLTTAIKGLSNHLSAVQVLSSNRLRSGQEDNYGHAY